MNISDLKTAYQLKPRKAVIQQCLEIVVMLHPFAQRVANEADVVARLQF